MTSVGVFRRAPSRPRKRPIIGTLSKPVSSQFLRPDADLSDGSWLNELGNATDLYASVDEVAADDGDYIESAAVPAADAVELQLQALTAAGPGPWTVRYRAQRI